MAEIQKPLGINKIWAAGGDILAPSDSKIATGWQVEIPPRQYFNYIDNKQDQFNAHVNQHGIPVWDSVTEYRYSTDGVKSLCMGTNGSVYRAKQTNINQNPVSDLLNTYWEIAFANIVDFYTKTQADDTFLSKSANGGDITNTATFRNNLSVYSQAQTYTRTEVDSKTAVASILQAQQQTSNTVLLSALRLADAFQGSNQVLGSNTVQKFPGGLIVQCGRASNSTPGDITITFQSAFPTLKIVEFAIPIVTSPIGWDVAQSKGLVSNSQAIFSRRAGNGTSTNSLASFDIYWISIGY